MSKFSKLYEASKPQLTVIKKDRDYMHTEKSGDEIAVHINSYADRPGYAVGEHFTLTLVIAPAKNQFGYGKTLKDAVNFEIKGWYATLDKFSTGYHRVNPAIVNKILHGAHVAISPNDRKKAYFISEDDLEIAADKAAGDPKQLNIKDGTNMTIQGTASTMLKNPKVVSIIEEMINKAAG
ncbi:hypothetical protein ZZ1p0080 [Acinetobacter phage ZZ1]|uniref:Uncharacterized protein n=3 Tax=Caudoviricetes TaxID=2731619 RepID=A0A410T5A6_9CAUD|nr:hypothetical protein ZZ1p0080 [Acinetobacter phage ZZ1]AFL47530.1 hypothetical protein ZZ1p0080 [Acinetobacter phage ZZ1]QAU03937.1 hypothetical protein Henu6_gp132 [Acinetobacter phage Henu6]